MPEFSHHRSIAGGGGKVPAEGAPWHCPTCGQLLALITCEGIRSPVDYGDSVVLIKCGGRYHPRAEHQTPSPEPAKGGETAGAG